MTTHVLFDFDGTLVDSAPGILTCFEQALSAHGLPACRPIDASLIERDNGLLLARHGIVATHAVTWPVGITTAHKAAAIAALEARGILIRQSA